MNPRVYIGGWTISYETADSYWFIVPYVFVFCLLSSFLFLEYLTASGREREGKI
jgi:hypothetical protein